MILPIQTHVLLLPPHLGCLPQVNLHEFGFQIFLHHSLFHFENLQLMSLGPHFQNEHWETSLLLLGPLGALHHIIFPHDVTIFLRHHIHFPFWKIPLHFSMVQSLD